MALAEKYARLGDKPEPSFALGPIGFVTGDGTNGAGALRVNMSRKWKYGSDCSGMDVAFRRSPKSGLPRSGNLGVKLAQLRAHS